MINVDFELSSKSIQTGSLKVYFITVDGVYNIFDNNSTSGRPIKMKDSHKVKEVICRESNHVYFVTVDNSIISETSYSGKKKVMDEFLLKNKMNILFVECGDSTSYFGTTKGVYAYGSNTDGQCCVGSNKEIFEKVVLIEMTKTKRVLRLSAGYSHVFMLFSDNSLYCCGDNTDSCLGLGTNTSINSLKKCEKNINGIIKNISCGYPPTSFILTDSGVYSCGNRKYIGTGGTHSSYPQEIVSLREKRIEHVYANSTGCCFVSKEFIFYFCGSADFIEYGEGCGDKILFEPVKFETDIPIVGYKGGGDYSTPIHFFVTSTGDLYTCGYINELFGIGMKTIKKMKMKTVLNLAKVDLPKIRIIRRKNLRFLKLLMANTKYVDIIISVK